MKKYIVKLDDFWVYRFCGDGSVVLTSDVGDAHVYDLFDAMIVISFMQMCGMAAKLDHAPATPLATSDSRLATAPKGKV